MTYNVFGGTLNLAQSIKHVVPCNKLQMHEIFGAVS